MKTWMLTLALIVLLICFFYPKEEESEKLFPLSVHFNAKPEFTYWMVQNRTNVPLIVQSVTRQDGTEFKDIDFKQTIYNKIKFVPRQAIGSGTFNSYLDPDYTKTETLYIETNQGSFVFDIATGRLK